MVSSLALTRVLRVHRTPSSTIPVRGWLLLPTRHQRLSSEKKAHQKRCPIALSSSRSHFLYCEAIRTCYAIQKTLQALESTRSLSSPALSRCRTPNSERGGV